MARGRFFSNQDIDIHLSQEEFTNLGLIEIKDEKIVHHPLEVTLEKEEGSPLKATVQKQNFDDLGDGIKVERTEQGFFVSINQRAYDGILDNSRFGTRYDPLGNKINFYIE